MHDSTRKPGRPRWPLGLIGSLLLIGAIESHVARHDLDNLSGSHWAYRLAGKNSRKKAGDCRVLCFGDSLLKLGFAPAVIEATSGLRAYNFAIAGGQAPADYLILKRALDSGARPSAILVDYFPCLLGDDPQYNRENWPFLATYGECLELARTAGDLGFFADLAWRKSLPSVRCRSSLRDNLVLGFRGQAGILQGEILRAFRNWDVNRGAEIVACRPDATADLDSWYARYFPAVRCSEANLSYVERFLDLAASKGIPVFWLLPPYRPALQARCELTGFDASHERFVRSILGRHPGLFVIDGRRSGYDPAVFVDLHHLGREGAATYTAEVGELVRRHLEAPDKTSRWIPLPVYRARPMVVPLEDGDLSRAVVIRSILNLRR